MEPARIEGAARSYFRGGSRWRVEGAGGSWRGWGVSGGEGVGARGWAH